MAQFLTRTLCCCCRLRRSARVAAENASPKVNSNSVFHPEIQAASTSNRQQQQQSVPMPVLGLGSAGTPLVNRSEEQGHFEMLQKLWNQ